MMPDIRIDNVALTLGKQQFHYDFALRGPELVAVTGPSGAGKSTLFHLIAGFLDPDRGRIVVNGIDMAGLAPGKRPITYIFQDHNLFAHLDVFTNVALGASPALDLTSADRAGISQALETVGLAGYDRRLPQSLSGGERQRVAFARAMVRKRPILLLDEPFASLDEKLRQELGDLLQAMQRNQSILVLMISHDRSEIARLADEVIEIDRGRNIFSGTNENWALRHNLTR
jgi:thiamine transport system ATP-binding protein